MLPVAMCSDAVMHGEALSQRNWELLREAPPVLFTHLVLEAMQDLQIHRMFITSAHTIHLHAHFKSFAPYILC